MEKIKLFNKGYTLRVSTWENDWKTEDFSVKTLEEAKHIHELLNVLGKSVSHGGLANTDDASDMWCNIDAMIENVHLLKTKDADLYQYVSDYLKDKDGEALDCITQYFIEELRPYLSSKFYILRFCHSVEVLYSDEDVYINKINL